MIREYAVVLRRGCWWVILNGEQTGPYASMLMAESSAILSAKIDLKADKPARVTVENKGLHVVYDSSNADAPGDTV